jgi:hypothetical protein
MTAEKAGQRMGDPCNAFALIKYRGATPSTRAACVIGDSSVVDLMTKECASD